ncbi:hypothetical protein TNCV_2608841 [Trichonephila clavipes]|uniref:Uncharacterized protein n=1 Tax=Trichonephila clavipes TaxID=2585209 RepID=A0A8X6S491_TRICX|nr:hypothetical protein TNCV_2608841 [Trichonephila clavipes]
MRQGGWKPITRKRRKGKGVKRRHPRFLPHTQASLNKKRTGFATREVQSGEKTGRSASSDNSVALGSAGTENSSAKGHFHCASARGGRQTNEGGRCSVAERLPYLSVRPFLLDGKGEGKTEERKAAYGKAGISRRAKAHLSRPAVNSEARMLEPEVARPTLASTQGPDLGSSLSLRYPRIRVQL